MKHTILMAAMATALMPTAALAQYAQPIPDRVSEVRLEDYATLRVVQGDQNKLQIDGEEREFGTLKGSTLVIDKSGSDLTLFLTPGRAMRFNTQDFSQLTFRGDFSPMDSLVLHTEDYSKVKYQGNDGDTLRARILRVHSEDYSHIVTYSPVQYGNGDHTADDYSVIDYAATDLCHRLSDSEGAENRYTNNDFAYINNGRYTLDGVLQHEREEVADQKTVILNRIGSMAGDFSRSANATKVKKAKKGKRHPWHSELDFAWGWHNWGDQIGNGFSGVDGAAEAVTNFHNIQLAVNIPVINVRGFALKAGVGLQWDKYRFATPEVLFDQSATPYAFAAGTWGSGVATSSLKARSVMLPVKLEFGNPRRWHFSLTALPGFSWTGKNTGLRRHYNRVETTFDEHTDKDYSVNTHFNPYRLDVRAAVQYKGIGVYVQAATLPLLKSDSQKLYPIMFGIII